MTSNLHVRMVQQRIEHVQVWRLDLDLRHGGNLLRAFHGGLNRCERNRVAPRQRHTQGVLHGGLAFLGRQLQDLQVLTHGALARVLAAQRIVGHAKMTRGEQVLAVQIVLERARLADQRVDDVAVVDPVLPGPVQPRHALHFATRVPHLHVLHPNHHVHLFPDQAAMHRVRVLLHLDRAALAHRDARQSPAAFQPPLRKLPQHRLFFRELLLPVRVAARHQAAKKIPVLLAADEVSAATQTQGLIHRVLEVPVGRFHVAVLMRLTDIDPLALQTIVRQEVSVSLLKLSVLGEIVHRRGEAVAPVATGRSSQFPERVLQPLAQGLEGLRGARRDRFPVRVRQREVIHQVRERPAADGYPQRIHVCEVGRREVSGVVDLSEHHRLAWSLRGSPMPNPPLERSPLAVGEFILKIGVVLNPAKQRDSIQLGVVLKTLLHQGPHLLKRIAPRPPPPRSDLCRGQLPCSPILACRLLIHVRLPCRCCQRRSHTQQPKQISHLTIPDHRNLLY